MIDPLNNDQEKLNTLSVIGQLATITVPILYILGKKYASAYFSELGCGWAINFLSFQETVFYALPIALPVLIGALAALQMMLDGVPFNKITKRSLYILLILLSLVSVFYFFSKFNYQNAMISIICYWMLVSFGGYISDLFLAMKRDDKKYLRSAAAWTIGSVIVVYNVADMLGTNDAKTTNENTKEKWPTISNGYTYGASNTQRLVTKVGDKYLVLEESSEKRLFKILSNLDGYSIHQIQNQK